MFCDLNVIITIREYNEAIQIFWLRQKISYYSVELREGIYCQVEQLWLSGTENHIKHYAS